MPDINRATEVDPLVNEVIDDMFEYHQWTDEMTERGKAIRRALTDAVKVIIRNAPPCPDRSTAIRKLREARMDAISAIAHAGKY